MNHIITFVARLELDINNCVGDAMTARPPCHVSGVHTRIREKASTTIYVHCDSHYLYLVLNKSSQLPVVRNMFATLSDVINVFNDSPKRRAMLEACLTFCVTRFIQRHDSILRFAEHFSDVLSGSQDIDAAVNMDAKTKALALSLLSSVSTSSFWYHTQQLRKSCR